MPDTRKAPRDAPVTVQFTDDERTAVRRAADTRGVSTSTLLRNITREWLAANTTENAR